MGSSGGGVGLGTSGGLGHGALDFLNVVQSAKSFSGRERNGAFLNIGGRFADISALSGFDLPDDGRGVALTDWDGDGDLDLWTTNRNGPQLRFFQNRGASGRSVQLRLVGTSCNRDAIGARVVLKLDDDRPGQQRTLRAGDAFLSQSSKWLHFGVGAVGKPLGVTVRWPGGAAERFEGVGSAGRFQLVQGTGRAERVAAREVEIGTDASPEAPSASSERVLTNTPFDVPELEPIVRGQRTLLVLYSPSCSACATELRELADQESEVRAAGLDVVALSVAGLEEGGEAKDLLGELGFTFRSGEATPEIAVALQMLNDSVLDIYEPLPVPCSFLIDGRGSLTAIYKGRVGVEAVLRDASTPPAAGEERRRASVPFAGTWVAPVRQLHFVDLALRLANDGDPRMAEVYYQKHRAMVDAHPSVGKVLLGIGVALLGGGDESRALGYLERAVQQSPSDARALSVLGMLRASAVTAEVRDGERAVALGERAVQVSLGRDAEALDALAAGYAELGHFFSAREHAEKALAIAREKRLMSLAEEVGRRLEGYQQRVPHRFEHP